MKLRLEPRELLAIGENDPADLAADDLAVAVDRAVAEDAVSPAIAERGLQPFVLAIKAMDDVVARDDRSAVTREGLQSLGLAGSDAAGERDRERPLHRYSVDSAPSAASASVPGSASGSASATGSSATGSSAASGSSTGAGSSTTSTSATGSSSAS